MRFYFSPSTLCSTKHSRTHPDGKAESVWSEGQFSESIFFVCRFASGNDLSFCSGTWHLGH